MLRHVHVSRRPWFRQTRCGIRYTPLLQTRFHIPPLHNIGESERLSDPFIGQQLLGAWNFNFTPRPDEPRQQTQNHEGFPTAVERFGGVKRVKLLF